MNLMFLALYVALLNFFFIPTFFSEKQKAGLLSNSHVDIAEKYGGLKYLWSGLAQLFY